MNVCQRWECVCSHLVSSRAIGSQPSALSHSAQRYLDGGRRSYGRGVFGLGLQWESFVCKCSWGTKSESVDTKHNSMQTCISEMVGEKKHQSQLTRTSRDRDRRPADSQKPEVQTQADWTWQKQRYSQLVFTRNVYQIHIFRYQGQEYFIVDT